MKKISQGDDFKENADAKKELSNLVVEVAFKL